MTPPRLDPRRLVARLALAILLLSLDACALFRSDLPRAGQIRRSSTDEKSPKERRFWAAIDRADVIYIAENHTDPAHHESQLELLKALKARGYSFAVGWEMFEAGEQPLLDEWRAHKLALGEMLRRLDWNDKWGALSPMYETLLRWTSAADIENVALNASAALARTMARGEPLTREEINTIPRGFTEMPGAFESFSDRLAAGPPPARGVTPLGLYQAQLLWQQTMADRITQFVQANPSRKLAVLIAQSHVPEAGGVPHFVRQKGHPRQVVVNPTPKDSEAGDLVHARPRAGRELSPTGRPAANRAL